MEWSVLVGALCAVGGLIVSYSIFSRDKSKDDAREGEVKGKMLSSLDYIKTSVDEIKRDQRDQREKTEDILTRLHDVEKSADRAHERIDHLEGKET